MIESIFIEELTKIGIKPQKDQLAKLSKYCELLQEYNLKINLTSIIKKEEVYLKHFYDSLTLIKIYNFKDDIHLCDVGTGAGFPGVVIKIFFSNVKVTLVDSSKKRIQFLNILIKELFLTGIETKHERIEDHSIKNRNKYDVVTTRAVAKLNIINELCIPITKIDGFFIAMKGNAVEEIKEVKRSLNVLNSSVEKIIEFELPIENSKRTLILIKKHKDTSQEFPRPFKKIKDKPL